MQLQRTATQMIHTPTQACLYKLRPDQRGAMPAGCRQAATDNRSRARSRCVVLSSACPRRGPSFADAHVKLMLALSVSDSQTSSPATACAALESRCGRCILPFYVTLVSLSFVTLLAFVVLVLVTLQLGWLVYCWRLGPWWSIRCVGGASFDRIKLDYHSMRTDELVTNERDGSFVWRLCSCPTHR